MLALRVVLLTAAAAAALTFAVARLDTIAVAAQTGAAEVVAFYKTVLRQRGFFVFETPPTHSFEVGRFRAETMNYPPGVTVKDFTSSGSPGYPNPRPGAQPARFPTVVQIVPV